MTGKKLSRYLLNKSLYDKSRSMEEFEYTVKLFEILLDDGKLSTYFKDTKDFNESDFFIGSKIKPAGNKNTVDDFNTLYGTVELLSSGNEPDDVNDDHEGSPKSKEKISDADMKGRAHAKSNPKATFDDALKSRPKNGDVFYIKNAVYKDPKKNSGFFKYQDKKFIPIS